MSETTTAAAQSARTGADVLLQIRHSTPTEADMVILREYLAAVGAACVDNRSGTQTWCHGQYSADWAVERWVGPQGHDLTFRFSGPNPVGPQRNGWGVSRRSSRCPEWALDDVAQRRKELQRRMTRMREVRATLERTRARVEACCGGIAPQHSASCGFGLTDGARRLRQACGSVRSWAGLTPLNDLGNAEVTAAIVAAQAEIESVMAEVSQAEAYAG